MKTKNYFVLAALLASSLSAHAGMFQYRVYSKGLVSEANLTISPQSWDFGTVNVSEYGAKKFVLTNTGNSPAKLGFGPIATPFSLVNLSCGASLAAQQNCNFTINYAPASGVADAGSLSISGARAPVTVSLSGSGAMPSVSASPAEWDFSLVTSGQTSTKSFTLTNSGNAPAALSLGALSAPFSLNSSCGDALAVAQSCSFSVSYTAGAAGTSSANLTVGFGSTAPLSLALSGTAARPNVSAYPATWDFGSMTSGQTSTKNFTLTNSGNASAALSFGGLSAPFSLANSCGATLEAAQSCSFSVSYTAGAAGTSWANLSIGQGGGVTPLSVALSGDSPALPGQFQPGIAGVTYSNSNQTITVTSASGTTVDVPFSSTKSGGRWYWEMQSAGQGAINISVPGGGYYLDFKYKDRNVIGTTVVANPSGRATITGTTNRYGFAVDATARTAKIYDVTGGCSVLTTLSWPTPGAVYGVASYRVADGGITINGYFAKNGSTCIPAGYSWWNR